MKKNLFHTVTMISLLSSLSAATPATQGMNLLPYGGIAGNDVFQQKSQAISDELSCLFKDKKPEDTDVFFERILAYLGRIRSEIASATNSHHPELYGRRRISQTPDGPSRIFSHTPMHTYPLMYENTIKWLGQNIPKNFKKWGATTEIPLGKTAKAVVQFLDLSVYKKYGILSSEELMRLLGEGNIGPAITRYMSSEMRTDNVFTRYTNLVRINIIREVKEDLPIERVIFIPVDSGCSFSNASVYILHPLALPGLSNWFEKEVESCFINALEVNKDVVDVRRKIAAFVYHFAVFMPYLEGPLLLVDGLKKPCILCMTYLFRMNLYIRMQINWRSRLFVLMIFGKNIKLHNAL